MPSSIQRNETGLAPPSPHWILRHHAPSAIHTLSFALGNSIVAAGDAEGRVSLTGTRDYRPRAFWQAHKEPVLSVEVWKGRVISHGRDNRIVVWALPPAMSSVGSSSTGAGLPSRLLRDLPVPKQMYVLEVNALNYCRFSLLPLSSAECDAFVGGSESGTGRLSKQMDDVDVTEAEPEALVAVPNTLESAWIDVYHIPSCWRVYEAIGRPENGKRFEDQTGIAMSLHLFRGSAPSDSGESSTQSGARHEPLRILAGYEDGRVALWSQARPQECRMDGKNGNVQVTWSRIWQAKEHREPVMALALSPRRDFAISVSADERVVRYDLTAILSGSDSDEPAIQTAGVQELSDTPSNVRVLTTKHPGRAAVDIRADGRVIGVGGWDGRVRLHSASSFRALAVLQYHKDSVYSLAFGHQISHDPHEEAGVDEKESDSSSDEDESTDAEHVERERWLACGGKDGRISLWNLPFSASY